MNKFERFIEKHAVKHLTLILIVLYAIGYVIRYAASGLTDYLTLNPYAIVHGQIWRLVSWLLVPPYENISLVFIVLLCFYSFGIAMERALGDVQYNIFILTGVILTIVFAFLWMGYIYLIAGAQAFESLASSYFSAYSVMITTYYINMSIFIAYSIVYARRTVLMFFILPMPAWILGVLDAAYMIYDFVAAGSISPMRFIIIAAGLNVLIFWLRIRNRYHVHLTKEQRQTRKEFRRQTAGHRGEKSSNIFTSEKARQSAGEQKPASVKTSARPHTMHKCAICGRTEADDPNLEFRYCSKCEGSYEYCQDHLFTHIHVKKGGHPAMMPASDAQVKGQTKGGQS